MSCLLGILSVLVNRMIQEMLHVKDSAIYLTWSRECAFHTAADVRFWRESHYRSRQILV